MRTRALLLVMTIGIAAIAVACGRASESDINSALGITPSPTQSAEEIATATAQAAAVAATGTAAAASGSAVASAGDITQGEQQFTRWCLQCHKTDGSGRGPALAGPDSPAVGMTDEEITDLIRNGTNHDPPGNYETFELSDRQIVNIVAYIHSIAE
jgi:mono/diheme cytochrome c family protein